MSQPYGNRRPILFHRGRTIMDDAHCIAVSIGLITNNKHILIGKRTTGHFASLWEFPGGKIELNETSYDALIREMHEELDINVQSASEVIHIREKSHKVTFHLQIWQIHKYTGTIIANEQQHLQWAPIDQIHNIDIIPTNIPIIQFLQQTHACTNE